MTKVRSYMETLWWSKRRRPPLALRVLAGLFGGVSALRRWLYCNAWLRPVRLPVPVIVVGNITVGGSGKTPLVIALVEFLRAQGWRPGVISRGYAGKIRVPTRVLAHSDPAEVGDEACLIERSTGAAVAVGRDRVAVAQRLLAETACDVLIADDGLQHYRLFRNVEICVIDGERRFGNEFLLPAGPLREPLTRLSKVSWRVCNGGAPAEGEVSMHLSGDCAVALKDNVKRKALTEFSGELVHAVAGIGNPQRFFTQLRAVGLQVIEHAFPDHHVFRPTDLDFADSWPVLMTEKDAVKCLAFAGDRHWVVPIQANLSVGFYRAVNAALHASRNSLKSNSELEGNVHKE